MEPRRARFMLDWIWRPRSRLWTAAQLRDITVRSVPPRDYQVLRRLESPAGYICVIRDIDSDRFRIDRTDHPGAFISAIMDDDALRFGIEIVSILETEDLRASETELYDRHHARLSAEWHALDAYQLVELRQSILQIDAHRSCYLARKRSQEPNITDDLDDTRADTLAETRYGMLMTSKRALQRQRQQRRPPPSRSYGYRPSAPNIPRASRPAQSEGLGKYLLDRLLTLLFNHPFKVIYGLALLLVLALVLSLIYGYHVTHNVSWR